MQNNLNHRYIARLIVEAQTPLFVGSGDSSLMKDALVQKDHNGLPMIPGTALAGVLRHSLENLNHDEKKWNGVFGFQNGNDGLGSRLKISSAYFLLGNNKIAEGFNCEIDPALKEKFDNLPSRQHVGINDKGVSVNGSLFDNEVVYKGAKFIFEIELDGTKNDESIWKQIIEAFKSPLFRIGQGTRKGYGNLKVVEIYNEVFDLTNPKHFDDYLNFDPSFNAESISFVSIEDSNPKDVLSYSLSLKPDSFFIFSEGFGDKEVDNKPLMEEVIVYKEHKIDFPEKTVIPASSIKGAIAHRVSFHYNKIKGLFADNVNDEMKGKIGDNNPAVTKLFGKKGKIDEKTKKNTGQRGILILDDLYYDDVDNNKILNHVAIDRFTGGAIDGALFSEKVSYKKDEIEFEIYLTEKEIDSEIINALEETLKDICKGLLPLGGMTTKGHGMFTGTVKRNGEEIFDYNKKTERCQTS